MAPRTPLSLRGTLAGIKPTGSHVGQYFMLSWDSKPSLPRGAF